MTPPLFFGGALSPGYEDPNELSSRHRRGGQSSANNKGNIMNIRGKRAWLTIISVVLAALVLAFRALGYHSAEFTGGKGIQDSGFFSYPRYHAQLGDLPLWKNGEYQFTVRGLPPDPLDLSLEVMDATDADRTELTSLSSSVEIVIVDDSGKQVCTGSGRLSDAQTRSLYSWVLESSNSHASFWHNRCLQLPISRSKTYTVRVTVSHADARSPHKMLMAVLKGGGNELP